MDNTGTIFRARVPMEVFLKTRHGITPPYLDYRGQGTMLSFSGRHDRLLINSSRIYELEHHPHPLDSSAPNVWDVRIKNFELGFFARTSTDYGYSYQTRVAIPELCWTGLSESGEPLYVADESWISTGISPGAQTFRLFSEPSFGHLTDSSYLPKQGVSIIFEPSDVANIPLHADTFSEFAALSLTQFMVEDKEGQPLRKPTDQELSMIERMITKALPKHFPEHIARRRQEELRIVGGEIPIVQPTLAENGAYAFALPIRVVNGCPRRCLMCNFYNKYDVPPTEAVLDQVDAQARFMDEDRKYVRAFSLIDSDALLRSPDSLVAILDRLNDRFGLNYEYNSSENNSGFAHFFAHPQTVSEKWNVKDLKRLRQAGIGPANLGFESGSQEVLDLIRKGFCLDQLRTAIHKLRQADIPVTLNIIPELGGADYEKRNTEETTAFLESIKPSFGKRPGEKIYLCHLDRDPRYTALLQAHNIPDTHRQWRHRLHDEKGSTEIIDTEPSGEDIFSCEEITFDCVSYRLRYYLATHKIPYANYQFVGL